MNRSRLTIAAAAATLGAGLALVPAVAQAAPAPTPVASTSPAAASPIVSVEQQVVRDRVVLTVRSTERGVLVLRDAAGAPVGTVLTQPQQPARFVLTGSGAEHAQYTITRQDGTGTKTVDVDFGAATLASPVDTTSYQEQLVIRRAVLAGQADQVLRHQALPGATVVATVNGTTTSAVADAAGFADVPVTFSVGENRLSVVQSVGGRTSQAKTSTYSIVA